MTKDDAERAIRRVLANVAQTCDWGAVDEYLANLTEDAILEMPANPLLGLPASRRSGQAAVRSGVEERRALGLQGPGSRTVHVVTTSVVTIVSKREATCRSTWLYYGATDESVVLKSAGRYDDVLRADDEGVWRLAHRAVSLL